MKNTNNRKETGLKLRVGGVYLNRCGERIYITSVDGDPFYPFNDADGGSYTNEGAWWHDSGESGLDLVEEIDHDDETNPKDLVGVKKPPLSLIPGTALVHCAMAFKDGAEKYTPFNWRQKKVQAMIYCDAILRHMLSFIDGEDYTDDSGVHHLGAAMSGCAVLLDAIEGGNLIDNRPPKGNAAKIIRRFTEC